MKSLFTFFRLELALSFKGSHILVGLLFYLSVVLVFPFAIGPDRPLITALGPAILWSGALFTSLFSLERLFGADAEDGSLDLYRMARLSLPAIVLVKALVLWLTGLLPLILAAPVFAIILDLSGEVLSRLVLSLALGTPALALLGTLAACLTAGLKRGGLLIPVLALPFALPVLIFGSATAKSTAAATSTAEPLIILFGFSLLLLVLTPWIGAKALDLGQE